MRPIVLAVLSLSCTGAAVLTTPVPVVGTVFAVAAPAFAVLGVILGGIDVSRARRANKTNDAALIGVIISALAFFPAVLTTLTCGVCNALGSGTPVQVQRDYRFDLNHGGRPAPQKGGAGRPAPAQPEPTPSDPGTPAPPPAIPPPPLPAGPTPRAP